MTIIKPGTTSDSSVSRMAERRVRQWTLNLETQRRRYEQASAAELSVEIHRYICISREAALARSSCSPRGRITRLGRAES